MKTITKTFYVSDGCFELLSKNKVILTISDFKDDERGNEIQISWQEPEREIKLTESEFDDHYDDAINELGSDNINFKEILRRKFFGASDE